MKVTSPNYPDAYDPLEYCTWNITAPPGHFVTLDFERIDVSNMFQSIWPWKCMEPLRLKELFTTTNYM